MRKRIYKPHRNQARNRAPEPSALKGLAAGVIGGLVASWVMSEFQSLASKLSPDDGNEAQQSSKGKSGEKQSGTKDSKTQKQDADQDDATVKAAQAISENLLDHRLTKSEKKPAGSAVHYAMGATSGAIYGITAELTPIVTAGAGVPFGAAVWLIADDVAVPALGLSKSPTEYPFSTHANALASHIVYGITTDIVRRVVMRAL